MTDTVCCTINLKISGFNIKSSELLTMQIRNSHVHSKGKVFISNIYLNSDYFNISMSYAQFRDAVIDNELKLLLEKPSYGQYKPSVIPDILKKLPAELLQEALNSK